MQDRAVLRPFPQGPRRPRKPHAPSDLERPFLAMLEEHGIAAPAREHRFHHSRRWRKYSPSRCTGIQKRVVEGEPDNELISTSYVERCNLSMRMRIRRFTRLTNGFSKKAEKHIAMLCLFFVHDNFCRIRNSLDVTPAMKAGIDGRVRDCEWMVGLIDERAPKPGPRGPYRKRGESPN